jgi:Spy/CpxP family protein refolding chaperone
MGKKKMTKKDEKKLLLAEIDLRQSANQKLRDDIEELRKSIKELKNILREAYACRFIYKNQ